QQSSCAALRFEFWEVVIEAVLRQRLFHAALVMRPCHGDGPKRHSVLNALAAHYRQKISDCNSLIITRLQIWFRPKRKGPDQHSGPWLYRKPHPALARAALSRRAIILSLRRAS